MDVQRTLAPVLGNSQELDGGAMFGNAPRALWSRWAPADSQNRIDLACRALLIAEHAPGCPRRLILAETGIGSFFPPELRERYGVVESEHMLLHNLGTLGVRHEDIDVVVLSHLHFDHAGGLMAPFQEGQPPTLLFPRATYVVGDVAWARAKDPHPRDRASFVPELIDLLESSGRLEIVTGHHSAALGPAYRFHVSHGHTPGQLLIEVPTPLGPLVFAGDLAPGMPWVHAPITMGYDRFPELLIDEKLALFGDLCERGGALFFTHDPVVAAARIRRDERGRFVGNAAPEFFAQWSSSCA